MQGLSGLAAEHKREPRFFSCILKDAGALHARSTTAALVTVDVAIEACRRARAAARLLAALTRGLPKACGCDQLLHGSNPGEAAMAQNDFLCPTERIRRLRGHKSGTVQAYIGAVVSYLSC